MHTPKVLIDRISVSDGLYLSDLRSVVSREGRAKIKEEFKVPPLSHCGVCTHTDHY